MIFAEFVVKSRFQSDFSMLGDRYEKMTSSMLNLQAGISKNEMTMGMLKDATMCLSYEDILPRLDDSFI